MTPLASLVTIKRVSGPEYTNRFNLFRSIQINGSPAPGYSSGQAMAAMEAVANEVLPAGFGYAWSDMSYQEKKAEGGQAMVFAHVVRLRVPDFGGTLRKLVVAVQRTPVRTSRGSWSLRGLLLRKFDNNVFAQIGLIMLIGLTAKNAILIVEFAILEHSKGKELVEAALEGARLRLRPILMTSFAFILGCVPLWKAKGAGAIGRRVLGSSVITGMSAATILGIFLVPVLFVVVERIAKKKPQAGSDQTCSTRRRSRLMRMLIVVALLPFSLVGATSDQNTRDRHSIRRPPSIPKSKHRAILPPILRGGNSSRIQMLQSLIREAFANNYDLRLAVSRVEQERALARCHSIAVLPASGLRRKHLGAAISALLRITPTMRTALPLSGKLIYSAEFAR